MYATRPEHVLFSDRGVTVTSARLVVGAQSYPLHTIASVSPAYYPTETTGAMVAGVCAVIFGVAPAALCMMSDGKVFVFGVVLLVPALLMLGIAITWAATRKAFYGVMVTTSGGQIRAVYEQDEAFTRHVIAALNQALAQR